MAVKKEKYFLEFNRDEIFKNLLAVEGHFRNIEKEAHDFGFLNCIVKHLADAEGHADEAISHALVVEGEESSRKFYELRNMIRDLRKRIQSRGMVPEEGIKEVRRIRRFFESFNPSYDVSKCSSCGPIEEVLKRLNIPKTDLREIEEENVDRIVEYLSRKYNVPKPMVRFLETCPVPEPSMFAAFDVSKKEIVLCRGGADAHKISHEFGHYLQIIKGKKPDEKEAEEFAEAEIRGTARWKPYADKQNEANGKGYKKVQPYKGRGKMVTWGEIGVIYGGQHIAKGLERAFDEVDKALGKEGETTFRRPSTLLNLGLGVFLPVIAIYGRVRDPLATLLVVIGGHMSTKVWEYVEEAMVGGSPAAAYWIPAGSSSPSPAITERAGASVY